MGLGNGKPSGPQSTKTTPTLQSDGPPIVVDEHDSRVNWKPHYS